MIRLWLVGILYVLSLATTTWAATVTNPGGGGTGGAGDKGNMTAVTATNPSAEAQLMELTLTSAALNATNRKAMVHGSGRYTTAAGQTPTLRYRVYLCTVSGCGSGTVLTLMDHTTAATTASTTNSWKIDGVIGVVGSGATGTVESKWVQLVQLGAAGPLSPEQRLDQNNAASSAIDLTGVLYVRFTVLASSANAGNNVIQRIGYVDGGAGTGGGGLASTDIDTSAELDAIVTDDTGSGALVFANTPTLVTPILGTPTSVTLTNANGTAASLTAGLATALAANGTNCSAGNYPLGVDASGNAETCTAIGAGTGDVVGPASATDNAIVRFDSTTGKLVQNSGVTIDDSNNLSTPGTLTTGSGGGVTGSITLSGATSGSLVISPNASTAQAVTVTTAAQTVGAATLTLPDFANVNQTFTFNALASTLTNKTVDAEGTGNVITVPRRIWLPAAGCNNATAGSIWDLPTANAPEAQCKTGTNTQKGVLAFDATTDESAQISYLLPSTWTGTVDARIFWYSATTTSPVAWCVQLVSTATGETDDPAFPAQATGNCVSSAAAGTTLQMNIGTITGATITGVAASELLHIRVSRDPDETSTRTDTSATDAFLIGVELTIREAM